MPQIPPFNKGTELTMQQVYDYILARVEREKNNPSVKLDTEHIGVGLNGDDIANLVAKGARQFIVFHAVENDTDTVILVGVDDKGYMIKNNAGAVIPIERWDKFGPTMKDVNDDVNTLYDVFK